MPEEFKLTQEQMAQMAKGFADDIYGFDTDPVPLQLSAEPVKVDVYEGWADKPSSLCEFCKYVFTSTQVEGLYVCVVCRNRLES